MAPQRVLIAGVGNVLRGDDGFGPAVVAALERAGPLPHGVRVVEVGIGGIALVHELMDGYDTLVLVDAVARGGEPGTVYVLEPELPDLATVPVEEQRILTSDMHQLVPARVLVIARALDVLPATVRMIGCEPVEVDELTTELSAPVARAVPDAVNAIRELLADCGWALQAEPEDAIRRRDEILQVMYWMRGEGLAEIVDVPMVARFLGGGPELAGDLEALVASGLLERTSGGGYRLGERGIEEGGRRFADEFEDYTHQGHGACEDPACDCHTLGPDACVHAQH